MLPSIPYQIQSKQIDNFDLEFRPFNVGMENILLLIKDSKKPSEIFSAILQLENECLIGKWKGKAKSLPSYVAEMLFVELRKISNGHEIPITLKCNNSIENSDGHSKTCGCEIKTILDLNAVELVRPDGYKDVFVIEADSPIYVKLHQIPAGEYSEEFKDISTAKGIYKHLESITFGDQIIGTDDISEEEFIKWCADMPLSTKAEIAKHFFGKTPHISLKMNFQCPNEDCGHKQELEFTSVLDFFI